MDTEFTSPHKTSEAHLLMEQLSLENQRIARATLEAGLPDLQSNTLPKCSAASEKMINSAQFSTINNGIQYSSD